MDKPALRVEKNAPGPFFVRANECMICRQCVYEAPELMDSGDEMGDPSSYFTRQPETPEEIQRALFAMKACCVAAVGYEGDDPAILARLAEWEAEEELRLQARRRAAGH